jgi:hypothetical protein
VLALMKKTAALLAIAFLASPPTFAGKTCHRVKAWSDVPQPIRLNLIESLGRIAEHGADFNSTDIVFDDTPQNRFFGGCASGKKLVLAIEHGGRGYFLKIFEFIDGKQMRTWSRPVPKAGFTPAIVDPRTER